jgi:superfamily II DNA or RNA helicase
MQLFDYQSRVLDDVRHAMRGGARSILMVLPTGSGKTVCGAHMIHSAESKGNPTLFTAHRRELVNQTVDKLQRFGVQHGTIMAGKTPSLWHGVQVASVDTLRARCMSPRKKMELPRASILMVDEAHRSCSPTYTKLIDHYRKDSLVIGLTATPIRGDGKGLGRHYDEMVVGPTVQELIDMGRLVQPEYFVPSIQDMTGVPIKKGDYVEKHLGQIMGTDEVIGDVVEHYRKLGKSPALLFAPDVKSSIGYMEAFNRAGIPAAHIDASTPSDERDRIIAGLLDGQFEVVSNVMVLTEGFDCPPVRTIIMCRPTRNLGLYLQIGGRGLRTFDGKDSCIIIDHSGNAYEHGKLEWDHDWKLTESEGCESREERQKKLDEKKPITCVQCSHMYTGQLICPNCGHMPKKHGKMVESRQADLVELRTLARQKKEHKDKPRVYTHEEKQLFYSMALKYAEDRGHKEGSVAHKYKERFGVWPINMQKIATDPSPEFMNFITHLNIRRAYRRKKEAA